MGQKINPLGFRLGTTQSHHSVWFEEPKNYSASLQEDQKIRKFFKNYVQKIIDNYVKSRRIKIKNNEIPNRNKKKERKGKKKSVKPSLSYTGILRIEIQKQIVHTKRTFINIKNIKGISNKLRIQKAIIRVIIYSTFMPIEKKIWKRDVRKQEFYYKYPQKFFIEINKVKATRRYSQPNLIAAFIAYKFKERVPFRKIMEEAIDLARKQGDTKGMKIKMGGRLEGKDKARKVWKRKGKLPLHRMNAKIDYCSHTIKTINGALGLKIWVWKK